MPQQLLLSGAVPPLPLKMVSAFFVLEDSTLSSGAIGVIPRSYNAGRAPLPRETSWNGSHALAVEARAGDVLLLRCDTWRIDMPRPPGGPATAQTLRVDYAERNIAQHAALPLWRGGTEIRVRSSCGRGMRSDTEEAVREASAQRVRLGPSLSVV